eukprot:SAG22_NODE_4351_length_1294_cov_1.463598_1_plen_75_part_00
MRAGEWKAVEAACANNHTSRPSEADVMKIYHLPTGLFEVFEATDVAATAAGMVQAKAVLAIAKIHDVSCHCFQC